MAVGVPGRPRVIGAMGPMRHAAVMLSACVAVFAGQADAAPREGVDYTIVQPSQPNDAPAGRIDVIEFFGYWCPACNAFEPTMRDWVRRNDATTRTMYVPLPTHFRAGQANFQKLYYTLDALGREKELRPKVFAAIHAQRSLPDSADAGTIADWAAANGIDRKAFVGTFDSFAVLSKVNRANQLATAYGVASVPALGIGGKYLLAVDAKSVDNADALVARVAAGK